jgi:hypothetical protein
MAWDQYTHPEFGFLCPTQRLRRELRIAVLFSLFGAIAGAVGVVALGASSRNTDPTAVASVITANTTTAMPSSHEEPTSATGTNAPDMPRVPLGSSGVSPEVSSNVSHSTANELEGPAQKRATAAAPPGFDNGMQGQAHSTAVPAKTLQATPRSQNRKRNEVVSDWRADHADPLVGRVDTNNRGGRLGNAYARQGFWDWSR